MEIRMGCKNLERYVDGGLTPAEKLVMLKHLEYCEECRDRLSGLRAAAGDGGEKAPPEAEEALPDDAGGGEDRKDPRTPPEREDGPEDAPPETMRRSPVELPGPVEGEGSKTGFLNPTEVGRFPDYYPFGSVLRTDGPPKPLGSAKEAAVGLILEDPAGVAEALLNHVVELESAISFLNDQRDLLDRRLQYCLRVAGAIKKELPPGDNPAPDPALGRRRIKEILQERVSETGGRPHIARPVDHRGRVKEILLGALSEYGPFSREELNACLREEGYQIAPQVVGSVLRRLEADNLIVDREGLLNAVV